MMYGIPSDEGETRDYLCEQHGPFYGVTCPHCFTRKREKEIREAAAVDKPVSSVDKTLAERGGRYGSFDGHAAVTQRIKLAYETGKNWGTLPDDMKEALEMIAHKIGRVLNGDPNYADSWHDICGYAKLVEDRLNATGK
jgi:hypothetical protein